MTKFKVLFSDLDGTLVHYPKEFGEYADVVKEDADGAVIRYRESGVERDCVTLTSMTGGKSYISKRTSALVQDLRDVGVLFVIITGARSSTFAKRAPSLPASDYAFFENGSRMTSSSGAVDASWSATFSPQIGPYTLDTLLPPHLPAASDRAGTLWSTYNELAREGWHLDGREYFANFRVDVARSAGKSEEDFRAEVVPRLAARGLQSTFNLGKADIYPAGAGKANAARKVLEMHGIEAGEAVAMFDDDNDVELGKLCGKAYLPGITHPSVAKAVEEHMHWEVTKDRGFLGTEEALEAILAQCRAGVSA